MAPVRLTKVPKGRLFDINLLHATTTGMPCVEHNHKDCNGTLLVALMKILQQNFLEPSFNAREQSIQNISQNVLSSPTSVHHNGYQIINNFKILHTFNNDIFLNSILFLCILHCAAHAQPHRISDLYPVCYYTPFPSYLLGFTAANG